MLRPFPAVVLFALASPALAQGWLDRSPTNPLQTPSPRSFPTMCWDAAHNYMLLFGGAPYNGPGGFNETWSWNGSQWTRRLTTNPPYAGYNYESPRTNAMAFHVPSNQVVMVLDGATWIWSGTDWLLHPSAVPSGAPGVNGVPHDIAMAYDPVLAQTVLFVGTRWQGGSTFNIASQTYVWDGFGWTARPTPTAPWPNNKPSMAFDPVAGRLVLATNGTGMAGFFEWTGANWQQRLPVGAPAAVCSLATDTSRQRLVMFDGVLNNQPGHTWTLANGSLQQFSPLLEPMRRVGAAMAYDPVRQRTVLFGGAAVYTISSTQAQILPLGDTWELELPAGASYTAYGTGCTGSRGVPTLGASATSLPRVGQVFSATVTNLPFVAPTFMFLGLSNQSYGGVPLPLGLGFLGAPGCSVLASGDDLTLVTNVLGAGLWQWPVPNVPGASFYNQAIVFDAGANPLGVTVSNGAHGVIGF